MVVLTLYERVTWSKVGSRYSAGQIVGETLLIKQSKCSDPLISASICMQDPDLLTTIYSSFLTRHSLRPIAS